MLTKKKEKKYVKGTDIANEKKEKIENLRFESKEWCEFVLENVKKVETTEKVKKNNFTFTNQPHPVEKDRGMI